MPDTGAMLADLKRQALRFAHDEQGGNAVEYAVIAAGIGAAVAGTVWGLGSDLKSTFYEKLAGLL